MEWVPTYPTSSTQFLPRSRCTVRFHCCVLGVTKRRGTASVNRNGVGIDPGLPAAQPNCPACVVSPPGPGVPSARGNPRNAAWQGRKLASSVLAVGSALKLVVVPGGAFEGMQFAGNGDLLEKNTDRQPGGRAPNTIGRNGAWNDSWSAVPTSSRT